jgi:hypothetical protein
MRHPLPALLVVLTLLLTIWVGGHSSPPASAGSSGLESALSITGDWDVKTTESYSDTAIALSGNLTVEAGGSLTLDSVTLTISEPRDLAMGVIVQAGGVLTGTNLVLESSNASRPIYLRATTDSTLRLSGGSILDLGGGSQSNQGLLVQAAGTEISGVTFDHYDEAIQVADAPNVRFSNLVFRNATGNNNSYALRVIGGSTGFSLTDSLFAIPQDVGALLVSAPNAQITGNRFDLDPYGTNIYPILLDDADGGAQTASGSYFANNTVDGAGVIDQASSNVTILDNLIENTGTNRPYGVLATVPVGTTPGLWLSGLLVQGNYITNYSRYGIRMELNVTHFLITDNTIVNPSPTPGPSWTVKFGGPQIDGIYLIRGISDGVVSHNYVDLSDVPSVASNGMTIESKVTDVKVQYNTFLNMSQNGIVTQGDVPGFDTTLPWQRGPTTGILIANNVFDNQRMVRQSNFTYKGLLFWLWANHTTVENNTFIGLQNIVNPRYSLDGATVITDGSYGIYVNNTVLGARLGFVFTEWVSGVRSYSGEFNRSDNLVYDNHLFGIQGALVTETPNDGMGPLHNVLDILGNTSAGPDLPTSFLESIGSAEAVGFSEANGLYTQNLRTTNPISGNLQTFSTTLTWSCPEFNATSSAGIGPGYPDVAVTALNRTTVVYHVPATESGEGSVALRPTEGPYGALYRVNLTAGSSTSSVVVNASTGTASFGIPAGSETTVRATLLSWWPIEKSGGGNNTTTVTNHTASPPSNWSILGTVDLPNGAPASNLSVSIQFASGNGTLYPLLAQTTPSGGFVLENLSFEGNLTSVTVLSVNYTTLGYTTTAAPGALVISVEVATESTSTPVNTTAPAPSPQPVGTVPAGPVSVSPAGAGNLALAFILDFAGLMLCAGLLGSSLRRVSRERQKEKARRAKYY